MKEIRGERMVMVAIFNICLSMHALCVACGSAPTEERKMRCVSQSTGARMMMMMMILG
jgi:hypothetical protein